MSFLKSGMLIAGIMVAATVQSQDSGDRTFGQFVLDSIETGRTAESIATEIRTRSIEVRSEWGKEGAVTEEERHWYENRHDSASESEKPGGGPPPWAPAHGYRRKFGEQQEADLGSYVHRCLQQGTTGESLIIAIRAAVDRVTRGEAVDPQTGAEHRNGQEEAGPGDGTPESKPNKGSRANKTKGKPVTKGRS